MTKKEFNLSDYENKHCEFKLKNGNTFSGVISTFFIEEPNSHQLVFSNNMREFKSAMDKNDKNKMKKLCQEINVEEIIWATKLPPSD